MRLTLIFLFVAAPLVAGQPAGAGAGAGGERPRVRVPDRVEIRKDLDYVGDGNPRQMLDVVLPKERAEGKRLPLIVFIHGGGWRNGSKDGAIRRLVPFVESGEFVGATINYRLTGESGWPTQIHDCKAAIRYLRGNAKKFGINPRKMTRRSSPPMALRIRLFPLPRARKSMPRWGKRAWKAT